MRRHERRRAESRAGDGREGRRALVAPHPGARGGYINGFINHDPEFMVVTERGTLVLVEVKGPHLDGSDSQAKAELGRADGGRLPEHAGEAVEAADAARDLR